MDEEPLQADHFERSRIRFDPEKDAKRSRECGVNVYRVGDEWLAKFLMERGWQEAAKGRQYTYMCPLIEDGGRESACLFDVGIPDRETVLAIAGQVHRKGRRWNGRLGEWVGRYYPVTGYTVSSLDPFTGDRGLIEEHPDGTSAHFQVGARGLWHASVYFEDEGPRFVEDRSNVLSAGSLAKQGMLFEEQPSELETNSPTPGWAHPTQRCDRRTSDEFCEGALRRAELSHFERSKEAREACIRHYGTKCLVCWLDLRDVYGEVAAGFIHVHHAAPLSRIRDEHRVDPVRDLVPLCPNCHAVAHLREPPFTVDELKRLFLRRRPCEPDE